MERLDHTEPRPIRQSRQMRLCNFFHQAHVWGSIYFFSTTTGIVVADTPWSGKKTQVLLGTRLAVTHRQCGEYVKTFRKSNHGSTAVKKFNVSHIHFSLPDCWLEVGVLPEGPTLYRTLLLASPQSSNKCWDGSLLSGCFCAPLT
jgi:hypothetical protein